MSETLTLAKIFVKLIIICIIAAVVYHRKSILEAIERIRRNAQRPQQEEELAFMERGGGDVVRAQR